MLENKQTDEKWRPFIIFNWFILIHLRLIAKQVILIYSHS